MMTGTELAEQIAENLGFATYPTRLKASIMSLTMGIRAYAKTLEP